MPKDGDDQVSENGSFDVDGQVRLLERVHKDMTIPFIAADLEGRFLACNPAFEGLTGYDVDELRSMNWQPLPPESPGEKGALDFARPLPEKAAPFEKEYVRKDGSAVAVEVVINRVRDEQGRVRYQYAILRDLSELRHMEALIRKTKDALDARVGERTRDLYELNARLRSEIGERKKTERELRYSEAKFRSFVEQSYDGIVIVNAEGTVIECNESEARITGMSREEIVGQPIWDIQYELMSDERKRLITREECRADIMGMLIAGTTWPLSLRTVERQLQRSDGMPITVQTSVFPIRTAEGPMIGRITRDVTEKKRAEEDIRTSLREKEVLLKEVHHRVKNNMQIISSILNLQANTVKDMEASQALIICHNRVRSMAFIHENLYRTGSFAWLDFGDYVEKLVGNLISTYSGSWDDIAMRVEMPGIRLGLNIATPCGLIINELVTNSLKHAFTPGVKGEILVRMEQDEGNYVLTVGDSGKGIPPDYETHRAGSLGIQIVNALVEQLSGTLKVDGHTGTRFVIAFPAQ